MPMRGVLAEAVENSSEVERLDSRERLRASAGSLLRYDGGPRGYETVDDSGPQKCPI